MTVNHSVPRDRARLKQLSALYHVRFRQIPLYLSVNYISCLGEKLKVNLINYYKFTIAVKRLWIWNWIINQRMKYFFYRDSLSIYTLSQHWSEWHVTWLTWSCLLTKLEIYAQFTETHVFCISSVSRSILIRSNNTG